MQAGEQLSDGFGNLAAGVLHLLVVVLRALQQQQRVSGGSGVDDNDLLIGFRDDVGERSEHGDLLSAG